MRSLVVWTLAVALLAALVGLSTLGPIGMAAALVLALGVLLLAVLGADRLGTALVLAAMVTAPMNAIRPVASADVVTFSDLFFVVGFALLAPSMLGARLRVPLAAQLGVLALLALGLLSSAASPDGASSLSYFARLVAAMVFLPLAFLLWRPSPRVVDRLAGGYLIGQVISVADGALGGAVAGDRTTGLTTHSNFFGLAGVFAIALSFHLLHRNRTNRGTWWLIVLADVVCLYGINLSGSRGALVVAVVLAVAYPLIERSLVGGLLLVVGGLVAVIAGSALLSASGSGSALTRLSGDATSRVSDNARQDRLQEGLDTVVHHPLLGTGFADAQTAHNIYVEIAAAAGIFGLVAYLLLLWSFLAPLFGRHPWHRLCYPVLAFVVAGPVNNHLWDRFIWAALALATVAMDGSNRQDAAEPALEPPRPVRRLHAVR